MLILTCFKFHESVFPSAAHGTVPILHGSLGAGVLDADVAGIGLRLAFRTVDEIHLP